MKVSEKMKTIKEIADELGVSKTAIRKKITDEMKTRFVETKNGKFFVNKKGENLIKQAFNKKVSENIESKVFGNDFRKPFENHTDNCSREPIENENEKCSKTRDESPQTSSRFDNEKTNFSDEKSFRKPDEKVSDFVEILKRELDVKNKTIENLQNSVRELTIALENTTSSLKAAQALHAGTLQQQISEKSEFEPQTIPQTKEIKKSKKGFWSRLFGRD